MNIYVACSNFLSVPDEVRVNWVSFGEVFNKNNKG